ncbi:MAG: hypothetical protein K2H61_00465 [Muribaculaceae bacterium]|nr:hypothetical protein [Muribaculaceae bacterium]
MTTENNKCLSRIFSTISGASKTRCERVTFDDVVNLLLTLSPSEIDSLEVIYCSSEMEFMKDSCDYLINELLLQMSSPEEVCNLTAFTSDYLENPQNRESLKSTIPSEPSIIRNCMLATVITVDNSDITTKDLSGNAYCAYQLHLALSRFLIEDAIQAEVLEDAVLLPEADLAWGIMSLGLDVFSAIKIAIDYHECRLTHIL